GMTRRPTTPASLSDGSSVLPGIGVVAGPWLEAVEDDGVAATAAVEVGVGVPTDVVLGTAVTCTGAVVLVGAGVERGDDPHAARAPDAARATTAKTGTRRFKDTDLPRCETFRRTAVAQAAGE
ncbi:MAG TPA: hypothetical protein VH371_05020, partial [Candidatus Limnocylindrales bacterium]